MKKLKWITPKWIRYYYDYKTAKFGRLTFSINMNNELWITHNDDDHGCLLVRYCKSAEHAKKVAQSIADSIVKWGQDADK